MRREPIMKCLPNGCLIKSATYAQFYKAYLRAREDKTNRPEVIRFERGLVGNLVRLVDEVIAGTYHPAEYREFEVHEPKRRKIHALPFRDRIVHQWYVHEFIIPFFVPRFIETSYACILDRGTHGALRNTQKCLRKTIREFKDPYVLKMDISGFFYNVNKDVLFKIVIKKMKDPKLVNLTRVLIYDGFTSRVSIPIGNYTSQYFANIYMNELDQFVKRVLKVKYYMRYMDDFITIVDGKEKAWWTYFFMESFIKNELKLTLNTKSRYFPAKYGIDFVGYRTFENYTLVRKRAKIKAQSIVRQFEKSKDAERFKLRASSWLGHAMHADSFKLKCKYFGEHKDLLSKRFIWEEGKTPKTPPKSKKPKK